MDRNLAIQDLKTIMKMKSLLILALVAEKGKNLDLNKLKKITIATKMFK